MTKGDLTKKSPKIIMSFPPIFPQKVGFYAFKKVLKWLKGYKKQKVF